MNKKTVIVRTLSAALLSALICLASCQSPFEQDQTVFPQGETVTELLELEFEDQAAFTKVGIAPVTGQFSWTDGDQVAVWYQNGATGAWSSASISANSLTVSGTGSRAKLAVYPYGAQTNFNLTAQDNATYPVTKIHYSNQIDLRGKGKDYAPVPMIALNDPARNSLKFYHVGGLIRFRLHGIPAGTCYIRITSNAAPLCGDFPVAIPTGKEINAAELVYTKSRWCTLYDENSWNSLFGTSHGQSVLVKITDSPLNAETDNITINLPVPMGVYDKLTVQAIGADGTTDLTTGVGGSAYEREVKSVVWDCERATATHLKNLALRPGHPMVNPKYVPGKFSVSPTKQVWFASGNLVVEYNADTDTKVWAFEDNQYDYSYGDEGDASYSVPGKTKRISHFGWATAGVKRGSNNYGYDPHHEMFQPYSIGYWLEDPGDPNDPEYTGSDWLSWYADNDFRYGPSVTTTTPYRWGNGLVYGWDENNTWNAGSASDPLSAWNTVRPYCDWGVHFDDDGYGEDTRTDGSWYTLSINEWCYLIGRYYDDYSSMFRENAGLLVGLGSILDESSGKMVNGYIILPDDWERPADCKFRPIGSGWVSDFTANMYTIGDNDGYLDGPWSSMQEAGALFLPAAGIRNAEAQNNMSDKAWSFQSDGQMGCYWTSSGTLSTIMYFGRDAPAVYLPGKSNWYYHYRAHGLSVRLVHD